jgi:hypothetical protein
LSLPANAREAPILKEEIILIARCPREKGVELAPGFTGMQGPFEVRSKKYEIVKLHPSNFKLLSSLMPF